MASSEIQNSNPTILNAADLPTRLRPTAPAKSSGGGGGIYATSIFSSALPASTNQNDPFASGPEASEPSDSEEDELIEEPIDEQEIFGTQATKSPPPLSISTMQVLTSFRSDIDDFRPRASHLTRFPSRGISPRYRH